MENQSLKPCPFCGCERVEIKSRYSNATNKYFWFAQCTMCKSQTGAFDQSASAENSWNTRRDYGGLRNAKG